MWHIQDPSSRGATGMDVRIFCIIRDKDSVQGPLRVSNLAAARGRRMWLRHCATSRKVAGSIPDAVIGIFH
jgi:hypothetical protein